MFTAWFEFPMGRAAALLAAIAIVVAFVRHLIFRLTNPRDVYRPTRRPPDGDPRGRRPGAGAHGATP